MNQTDTSYTTIVIPPHEREFAFTDEDFRFLSRLANAHTGIVLTEQKRDMVYGRLVRRLRALGLESFHAYCKFLESDEGQSEIDHLINAITTNLTSFFRESHHFAHLSEQLKQMAATGARRLRIWSAGCSSGMEPYSIAMTVREAIPDIDKWDAKILATDIDTNILHTAQNGIYTIKDVGSVPEKFDKYIQSVDRERVQMSHDLKKMISFRPLNLMENWPMKGPFDVIFCRNVFIYFDKETKAGLVKKYADLLKPSGWLYIGHSENLSGLTDRFELLGRTIYRRVK